MRAESQNPSAPILCRALPSFGPCPPAQVKLELEPAGDGAINFCTNVFCDSQERD